MELFKIVGTIAVSNSDANDALDETAEKASGTNTKVSTALKSIGNAAVAAAKVAAGAIATITVAFGTLATIAVRYNAEMEQYQTSFEVMLGSEEDALKMVNKLKETAAKTPFEMTDLASTTQLLLNYGITAEEVSDKIMMLGDIAQGDAQKMQRVATAYGQMSSAGKVSLEDVKQMIEAGYNPLQEISDSTGESMESLYDRISKGTLSVDEITASMERSTSEGGKYYQSMEKQSKTLKGQLSTLKDTINNALGEAFKGISDVLGEDVIPKITEMAEKYIPVLGEVIEKILPYIMQAAEEALPVVVELLDLLVPMIVEFAEKAGPVVGDILSQVLPLLLQVAQTVLPKLYEMMSKIGESELLGESFTNTLTALSELFVNVFDLIYLAVTGVLALLEGDVATWGQNNLEGMKKYGEIFMNIITILWETILKFIVAALASVGQMLWDFIVATALKVKNKISEVLTNIKNTIVNKFIEIKNGIKNKIEDAVTIVKEGIEKLKSFFDFEWELPKLKMPHFTVSGSFSLDPLSVPSFGVDWYAKGAVLNEPTAFGINGNKLMVGGEAGPEAIAPISTLQRYVADAVASQNADIVEVLYRILGAIVSMDGNMGANMRDALAGTSFNLDRREFARLVKAVN